MSIADMPPLAFHATHRVDNLLGRSRWPELFRIKHQVVKVGVIDVLPEGGRKSGSH